MDMDYRIRYHKLNGEEDVIFCDGDLKKAKRTMNKMRNEKVVETQWAEMYCTDWENESDADEGFKVVCGFDRKTINFMGRPFPNGTVIEY